MSKQISPVDVIIPTYNNVEMLTSCINSISVTRLCYPVKIIVVNNGHPASLDHLGSFDWLKVVQTGGKNLGWEGGLKLGLEHSRSEFVMFMNDDTFVPQAQSYWIRKMIESMGKKEVAAVGPTSNVVMGKQNMIERTGHESLQATFLIGFCMLVRRAYLDEVGGVDDTLPGGDDLDLSIRLRKAGYSLVIRRDVFVFHYGFQTGTRLHGGANKTGGWNSKEMSEKTNMALIRKHGFSEWFKCVAGYSYPDREKGPDHEGDIVRENIIGEKILDLGCANNKTVPNAVGVDRVKNGDSVPFLNANSESDVLADVEEKLPFDEDSQDTVIARHIFEHCIDSIQTLREWMRVVRPGGRLIIAVPNEKLMETIPLNGEHVHAFTPASITNLGMVVGLKPLFIEGTLSGSIVAVFEKAEK